MTRDGGCYCGDIRYTLDDATKDGLACYCTTCQKLHAGASLNLKSTVDAMKVTKGTPTVYTDNGTDSGTAIHRSFCGCCGSALFSDPDGMPGVRFVKAGSLDDPGDLRLAAEIYVDKAIPGSVKEKKGQKQFEGMMAKEV